MIEVVVCESTKGEITLEVHRDWAPHGADRFLKLVELGFYENLALFRVNRWIVQTGAINANRPGRWRSLIEPGHHHLPRIPDDPPTDCGGKCTKRSLFDGAVAYAGGGLNSRSEQIFFVHHRGKSQPLGESPWEIPFANVTKGLDVIRSWYAGYGEKGVNQVDIMNHGNDWAKEKYPKLDFLVKCQLRDHPSHSLRTQQEEQDQQQERDIDVVKSPNPNPYPSILFLICFLCGVFTIYKRVNKSTKKL